MPGEPRICLPVAMADTHEDEVTALAWAAGGRALLSGHVSGAPAVRRGCCVYFWVVGWVVRGVGVGIAQLHPWVWGRGHAGERPWALKDGGVVA